MKKVIFICLIQFFVLNGFCQTNSVIVLDVDGVQIDLGQDKKPADRNSEGSLDRRTYVSKDIFGNTIIKDEYGHTIKSIEKDIFGNTIVKDGNGHTIKSIEKDIFGDTIIKDGNGHTIKSIEKDIFGNTVVKDGNGQTVLSIGKDIFGVYIVKDANGKTILSIQKDDESCRLIIKDGSGIYDDEPFKSHDSRSRVVGTEY